ncbi:MAG: PEP-CTERM sorting domain-containing protein [Armatimonadetes bacterium]|nr:PEP-CTERM sorting domain-containing protein [Armatimonadota bacterium]
MIKHRKLFIWLTVVVLVASVQCVFARDYWDRWDGHWNRGDAGTTHQAWEFPHYESGTTGHYPTTPNISHNDYGTAELWVEGPTGGVAAHYPDMVPGPDQEVIPTLHIGDEGEPNHLNILIPNQPVHNWVKLVFVQITSDKGPYGGTVPTSNPPGHVSSPATIWQHPYDNWYTYNWLFEIHPNPEWEVLTFVFPGSTNIEEIVVDTICTVPEPSSLAILGPGLVAGLMAFRRRKTN